MWSDVDITRSLKNGRIKIDPFDNAALQPASVDLRLHNVFYSYYDRQDTGDLLHRDPVVLDTKLPVADLMFRSVHEDIIIQPGEFLLGSTYEKVSLANDVVGRIEGKSSLARIGLSVHITGGFIDPGNQELRITLEMFNHAPIAIKLYAGMWIAQIAFQDTVTSAGVPYGPKRGSRYYADDEPVPSRINEKLR